MTRRELLQLPAFVGLAAPLLAHYGTKPTPSMDARYMTTDEAACYVARVVKAYLGAFTDRQTEPGGDGWKGMCAFGCYSSHPDRLLRVDVEKVAECIVDACVYHGVNGWCYLELPHGLIRTEHVGPLRVSQAYDVMIDEIVTRFDMGTCKNGQRVWAGGPAIQIVRGRG